MLQIEPLIFKNFLPQSLGFEPHQPPQKFKGFTSFLVNPFSFACKTRFEHHGDFKI